LIYLVSNIFSLLEKNFVKKFFLFQILIVFSSIFEILAILSVGPFVAVMFNSNLILVNEKIKFIYTYFNFNNSESFLIFLGIFTFVVMLISSILSIFINWKLTIFSQSLGYNLSNRLFKFFLNKKWNFFLNNQKNLLISKIQIDTMRLTNEILRSFFIINSKIILTVFIFFLLIFVSWHLALISIVAFSLFYFLFYFIIRKRIFDNSINISRHSNDRIKILNESFYGIKQIILSNIQEFFYNRFFLTSKILSKSLSENLILSQIPKNILELLSLFLIIFIILFLAKVFNNDFSVIFPIIAIYSLSAFKLIPALQQIYASFVSIKGSFASFQNINRDLKDSLYLENKNTKLDLYKKNNSLNLFNHSLNFKNVSFRYPSNKKYVLKKINFRILKNEKIAIVGSNGSGKSTLLDLILGLLKPSSGSFYIDNFLLKESKVNIWQKNISYIYQNSVLFDGTILDNIIFGIDNKKKINYSKIDQIITQVGIQHLLKKLSKGLNTQIGENGSFLSGGQKQKIILARSLYKDTDTIVIDEATSALDNLSEKIIINHFINKIKEKTIIIVSHKINLLKKVDKIILIKNGKIEAIGPYKKIKSNKIFQELI
jgi:ABC-type bacteriocin/lantibiotic exporter with double-glycine peptidase domain